VVALPFTASGQEPPRPSPPPLSAEEAAAVAELKKSIAGKEETPSKDVFKNVQIFGSLPAGRLLMMMERGYTRSLGVSCVHCHVVGKWESDEKTEKGIAREMVGMARAINEQYLKKIANIKSQSASVSCSTCHRGQARPGAERPAPPPQPATTPAPPK
jgi:hypothetical protein